MPFSLFRDRFRDLADRETRAITRLQDSASGLPAGQYALVEMFCDEPGCDCRRVLFTVIDTASGRCEAVINFGWEEASFYAAWLREDDPHMVAALQGPALHIGPAQGKHANAILDFAKQLLLGDAAYVARVKRHYAMFREDVEQGNRPGPDGRSMKIGRNDPCPCGSGRKYKKCCLGIDRGPGADTKSAPIATSGALFDRVKAQVIDKSRLRITEDVDHIVEQAMARSTGIVRLGQLVLFATADGDAWLLDRGDRRALPLARAGERLPARIVENGERFTIECSHDYEVRGDLFVVEDIQSGSREVFTGYPTAELGRD